MTAFTGTKIKDAKAAKAKGTHIDARALSSGGGTGALAGGLSMLTGATGGKRSVPNVPLLDLASGQWSGLWDLFKGCMVVMEFYLSSMGARSVAPVVAIDP